MFIIFFYRRRCKKRTSKENRVVFQTSYENFEEFSSVHIHIRENIRCKKYLFTSLYWRSLFKHMCFEILQYIFRVEIRTTTSIVRVGIYSWDVHCESR